MAISIIHPFSEGNSRTLRSFTRQLAEQTGHELDWNITNANAVTRDALYKARDNEVLRRTYPAIDAVSAAQQDGDRLLLKAAETLRRFANADRLDELIRQSAEQSRVTAVKTCTVSICDAEAEIATLLPAAQRQAAATEEATRVASLRNRSLMPTHWEALSRKSMLEGARAPGRLLGVLRDQGVRSITLDRVPGEPALDRVLAYREGMEKQLADQLGDTLNGPTQTLSPTPIASSRPHPERLAVHSRNAGRSSISRAEPATAEGRDMQGLLSLGRGSTLAGLADKVPAGRSIPDGAEQVVVMNGSRLHERRHEGKWEVQKSDPQGMLPKGVFRLDTAASAKADDGGNVRRIDPTRQRQRRFSGTQQRGRSARACRFPTGPEDRRQSQDCLCEGTGDDHGQ